MTVNLEEDDSIVSALNRIAENQEETNSLLAKIGGHYDSIVPVMKRNADKVDEAHNKEDEFGWGDYLNPKKVFRPQEN